ncbi:hypothetical protein CLIB1423_06S05380 [[Candida] railenensis]|uniref:Uncharacterized protein n=1 Tax=[Candida] railenensis TaxID=45579 RepID=A0A9P0QPN5_9ASCO|nr:hypothetical protein CLIB1423_06S05380 [[Candida] railenensis]
MLWKIPTNIQLAAEDCCSTIYPVRIALVRKSIPSSAVPPVSRKQNRLSKLYSSIVRKSNLFTKRMTNRKQARESNASSPPSAISSVDTSLSPFACNSISSHWDVTLRSTPSVIIKSDSASEIETIRLNSWNTRASNSTRGHSISPPLPASDSWLHMSFTQSAEIGDSLVHDNYFQVSSEIEQ